MKIPRQLAVALLVLCVTASAEDPPWKKPEPWVGAGPFAKAGKKTAAQLRAEKIIFPKIDFRETTIREALGFLTVRSRELDPDKKGVNVIAMLGIVRGPQQPPPHQQPKPPVPQGIPGLDPASVPHAAVIPAGDSGPVLTLSLKDVPLSEVLKYVTNLANLGLRWDEHAAFMWELQPEKPDFPKKKPMPPVDMSLRPPVKNNAGKQGEAILARLAARTVIPKVDFRETTLREAFDFIVQKDGQLNPDAGMNLALKLEGGIVERAHHVTALSFTLTDIPSFEVLRYMAELSGCDVILDGGNYTISIIPATPPAKRK